MAIRPREWSLRRHTLPQTSQCLGCVGTPFCWVDQRQRGEGEGEGERERERESERERETQRWRKWSDSVITWQRDWSFARMKLKSKFKIQRWATRSPLWVYISVLFQPWFTLVYICSRKCHRVQQQTHSSTEIQSHTNVLWHHHRYPSSQTLSEPPSLRTGLMH